MKFETRFETLKLADIIPAPYNPREDIEPGTEEYKRLRKSLEDHGMVEPPVVNIHNMRCIGGNQRLTVLRDMGVEEVLCSVIDQPDESKEMKLCLALNRIEGRWDTEKLGELLRDDDVVQFETGFDPDELAVYRHLENTRDPDDWPEGDEDPFGADEDPDADEAEEPDAGSGDDEEPAFNQTIIRIGHLSFKIEVFRYKRLLEQIRDSGIFDEKEIAAEMKRRLLEND